MAHDIFISYRESDGRHYAETLRLRLEINGYKSVYFNPENVKQSDNYVERLKSEVNGCQDFIIVITTDAVKGFIERAFDDDPVQQELKWAMNAKKI